MKFGRKGIVYTVVACISTAASPVTVPSFQLGSSRPGANSPDSVSAKLMRQVSGDARTVRVPMVSESWSATVGGVTETEHPELPEIGHFPGVREWKRQANERRRDAMAARSGMAARASELQFSTVQPFAAASAPGVVFDGPSESDTHAIPPDPQLAAGPNYIVVVVNSLMAIYDKSGNLQGSFQTFDSFFSSLGITGRVFDPRIIYDQTDQRFIFSTAEIDFTNLSNGHVFLAVSATNDPTGIWYKYALNSEGRNAANTQNTFPDFPGLGLSESAVYITTNQFELAQACLSTDTEGCYFSDAWVKVIGLAELLAGNPTLNITAFTKVQTASGFPAFAVQPAVTYGSSSNEFLVAARFDANPSTTLDLFAITTSGTPTLTAADLTVPNFSIPPDALQAGTNQAIATDDFRPLTAVWANGSLWFGQNTADSSGSNVVARWYQLQIADLGSASVAQSGTVNGNGDAYYPAVSVKADGAAGLAFTTSSSFQPASAAFTAREAADPPGTMRSYSIYRAGSGPYDEPVENRWGDYSAMSEDPDGNSFWAFAEYAGTSDPHFGTAAAQVIAPPAVSISPALLDFKQVLVGSPSAPITVTVTNLSGNSVGMGTISVSGANRADFSLNHDTCSGTSLGGSLTCTLSVTFKPSVNNWEDALLSIPYGPGNLVTVGMQGFGLVQAILSFTPASVTFPPTVLQSASTPQVITFMNTGNASAQLSNPAISGDFTQTNDCGSSLAAGASCHFTVIFHPTLAGGEQGWISYLPIFNNQTPFVSLSGVGIPAPAALFCPSSLTFSSQTVSSTSPAQSVILSNNGSAPLHIAKIKTAGDFAETDDCLGSVPARGSCVINVTFTPVAVGSRSGTLTLTDDAQGSPQTLTLTGTGTAGSSSLLTIPSEAASALQLGNALSPLGAGRPARETSLPKKRVRAQGPFYFEPNVGQFNPEVDFVAHVEGSQVALSKTGLRLRLLGRSSKNTIVRPPGGREPKSAAALSPSQNAVSVTMALLGASPATRAFGMDEMPARLNYFVGNDPKRWRTNVMTYSKVKLRSVYPGIDLVYYGNQRELEYDFVVAPHANPSAIRLQFAGGMRVRIDPRSGDLVLNTPACDIRFHKPLAYQTSVRADRRMPVGSNRQPAIANRQSVEGHYVLLATNKVGFALGGYDQSRPLFIDPVLSFSTYIAGSVEDQGNAIAVDASGNAYVAGSTRSPDFPISSGAFKKSCGSSAQPCVNFESLPDAFVSKLGADGSLIYSTYLGGAEEDVAQAIAVDSSGNAYVTGYTVSPDFPVTAGAFQTTCPAGPGSLCGGGFVTKLNPSGSALIYSTYLGGGPGNLSPPNPDQGLAIGVDASGDAFVGGLAVTLNFPTTPGAFQPTATPVPPGAGNGHGFLAALNPSGTSLLFSTYLGGTATDRVNGLALDNSGNVYVAGQTNSLDFPTSAGAFQPGSYESDSFIAKFSPSGSLRYSTYFSGTRFGGGAGTQAQAIAVDFTGAAYVTGATGDALPVTPGAYQTVRSSAGSAFVTKLHPAGCALLYSTYVGYDVFAFTDYSSTAIALDSSNNVYITGNAYLSVGPGFSGPALVHGPQPPMSTPEGTSQIALLSELNPTGSTLLFSSFLGGSGENSSSGIAVDSAGNIFVTGTTNAPDFPVANPFQPTCPACEFDKPVGSGVFVTKISPQAANAVLLTRNALTFAPRPVGSSNIEVLGVGLMNQLSVPLNISSVNVTGSGFSVPTSSGFGTIPCSGAIAPGAGCIVQIQYSPNAMGPQSGTLTITDDGPGSPRTIALNGTGEADFILEAPANSTSVAKGTDSTQFTIQATGIPAAPVLAGNIALTCASAAPATCTFSPSSIPTVGGTTTLTVSGLARVTAGTLDFSVAGSLSGQTYSLPLAVIFEDFTLTTSQSSATIKAGQTATYSLTVTPTGGFNQSVGLACSGAPSLSTCSVSGVTLDGTNPAKATVTVATTAGSFSPPRERRLLPPSTVHPLWVGTWLLVLILLCIAAALAQTKAQRAWLGVAVVGLTVALWVSCGGGGGGGGGPPPNPGTPPGTYSLTITGTFTSGSASLTHTVQLTLTVN